MKRLNPILLLLLLLSTQVHAQGVVSPNGRFRVNYTNGCSPLTINFTDLSGAAQVSYYLNYIAAKRISTITTGNTSTTITDIGEVYLVQLAEGLSPVKDSVRIEVYSPVTPQFRVYACSNFNAQVEVVDRNYDYYEVQFNNSSPQTANAANNYTVSGNFGSSGDYPVKVLGRYNNDPGNCSFSTKNVTSRATLAPAQWQGLQWSPERDSVYLQYQLDPQLKYQLERQTSNGTFEKLFDLSSTSTDTAFVQPGLAGRSNCFRIKTLNSCSLTGAGDLAGPAICTANWSLSSADGTNRAQYQADNLFSGEVQLLDLQENILATSSSNSGHLLQENINCGQSYCYQLRLLPADNSVPASMSAPMCVTGKRSTPLLPLKNIASYWFQNQLVALPHLAATDLSLDLYLQNSTNQRIASAQGDSLVYNVNPSASCYFFNYADMCGNAAAAPTQFCPLYLRNLSTEADVFAPGWNAYIGYELGVQSYTLQELDEAGNILQEWPVGNANEVTPFTALTVADNGRRFRVKATPTETELAPSYSNLVVIKLVVKGFFPNAFSPNGDGLNDEFKILGKFVAESSVWLYNRWGEVLFHSQDKDQGWNGEYKGKLMPPGPYVYKAEVVTTDGQKAILTGTVFLTH